MKIKWVLVVLALLLNSSLHADWMDGDRRKEVNSHSSVYFIGSTISAVTAIILYKDAALNDYNSRVVPQSNFNQSGSATFQRKAAFQRDMGNLFSLLSASLSLGGIISMEYQNQSIKLQRKF